MQLQDLACLGTGQGLAAALAERQYGIADDVSDLFLRDFVDSARQGDLTNEEAIRPQNTAEETTERPAFCAGSWGWGRP
jgi:hypothetical protein